MTRRRGRPAGQLPTDPAERARVERLDAERKARRGPPRVEGTRPPRLTDAEREVIRRGRQAARTWAEVNSTKSGGRDLGPY